MQPLSTAMSRDGSETAMTYSNTRAHRAPAIRRIALSAGAVARESPSTYGGRREPASGAALGAAVETLDSRRGRLGAGARAIAVLVVLATLCAVVPATAHAAQEKHALPSIAKVISSDGTAFSDSVTVARGASATYRVTLGMPEAVEQASVLDYVVEDKPDAEVVPDARSVRAWIVDANGAIECQLKPNVASSNGRLRIDLGDLKQVRPSLSAHEKVLVEYGARVSSSASQGRHPNIAKLQYDLGEGQNETVEVMATALVELTKQSGGSTVVKTGDALAAMPLVCLVLAAVSAAALAFARRRIG